jgi:hypothetical protein
MSKREEESTGCPQHWNGCKKNQYTNIMKKVVDGMHECLLDRGHKGKHKCGFCGEERS